MCYPKLHISNIKYCYFLSFTPVFHKGTLSVLLYNCCVTYKLLVFIYFYVFAKCYLTMLSVARTAQSWTLEYLVNKDLETMSKEAVVA